MDIGNPRDNLRCCIFEKRTLPTNLLFELNPTNKIREDMEFTCLSSICEHAHPLLETKKSEGGQ